MITETEAKTKLCHMTFTSQFIPGKCQASNCMAWRWMLKPDGSAENRPRGNESRGYCGLADKP